MTCLFRLFLKTFWRTCHTQLSNPGGSQRDWTSTPRKRWNSFRNYGNFPRNMPSNKYGLGTADLQTLFTSTHYSTHLTALPKQIHSLYFYVQKNAIFKFEKISTRFWCWSDVGISSIRRNIKKSGNFKIWCDWHPLKERHFCANLSQGRGKGVKRVKRNVS